MKIDDVEILQSTIDQIQKVYDGQDELEAKKALKEFQGMPMKLEYAKNEIERYFRLGIDKCDIAVMVASWGLSSQDFEKANEYLHVVLKKNTNFKPQEGIII